MANVKQAVPFFGVRDIDASLRFYCDGLGFTLRNKWVPEGRIRWCWLELGDAALMLQEYWKDGKQGGGPAGPLGEGVSICFMCENAIRIYHDARAKGLEASRPFVGNALWVTSLTDPDGYRLDFESPTEVAEGTVYEHVLFVCEHGAAKSVLAASYFNALAGERGLWIRAISRGTAPDAELSPRVVAGLAAEGVAVAAEAPRALAAHDLDAARLVVCFDQPQVAAAGKRREACDGFPAVSEDFERARSAIKERVVALVHDLADGG